MHSEVQKNGVHPWCLYHLHLRVLVARLNDVWLSRGVRSIESGEQRLGQALARVVALLHSRIASGKVRKRAVREIGGGWVRDWVEEFLTGGLKVIEVSACRDPSLTLPPEVINLGHHDCSILSETLRFQGHINLHSFIPHHPKGGY